MSHIERLTPRPALHQKRVDLPVSANTVPLHQKRVDLPGLWHCIIAPLHQNRVYLPGRTNNFNELQIVANAKKTAWPGRYPQKRHGSFTGTAPRLSAWCFLSKQRLHPQPYCRHHHRCRAAPAYGQKRGTGRKTNISPHRAGRQPAV
jgi:hypothetical protein